MDQNNVLRLDISMKYLRSMHQRHCIQQIADNERSTLLRQGLPSRNDIIELPIAPQLKYSIKMLLIGKEAIGFDDIGMV